MWGSVGPQRLSIAEVHCQRYTDAACTGYNCCWGKRWRGAATDTDKNNRLRALRRTTSRVRRRH